MVASGVRRDRKEGLGVVGPSALKGHGFEIVRYRE
jgi:hypothetical protein